MTTILVTGGAGFIGANFVHHWRKVNPDDGIVVLDALTYAGNRANLDGLDQVDLVEGDICNTNLVGRLLRERGVDTLVHFAAESHVDRSITGPDAFVTTNVVGTHSLLKAAKTAWLDSGTGRPHRFHHVSTDEVYGSLDPDDAAFSETTAYAPNSPYSASKAGSDHLVRAYHHTYGLETTTSNCSNNYGPFQFPEKLIPLFTLNALSGRNLPIYGDGMNVRDWLHVEDHCYAIELILKKGRVGEVYNVGGGQELPNVAVIEEICRGVDAAFAADPDLAKRFPNAPAANGGSSLELKTYITDRKGHDRRYAIDETKIRGGLGYEPKRDFPLGFAETLAWYLAREDWWQPLLRRAAL
ncbi:dTDP-glucose 4,6-dehydratase [Sphingomonas sp. BAUL-RG-20F-R05-02]|uniref:dTDP-glucose 4,6-dehydratase n=1 Tax=Sphingomonas sp. BAUL-RG-20F-R05-02 TaxID=2914830 RepID=UPI001F59B453|nr:dTDP-glucose 4,6-dehydratase [Sphingomonas sp. BAUL-RG-20F-R05-02]